MTNRFKQCPRCEQRINTRTSRDMLSDGTRREVYRECKHCGHHDHIVVRQEIIFVSCCDDNNQRHSALDCANNEGV